MNGRVGYTRFLLFSIPRTGSTLLIRTLRQHPHIACLGEVFNRDLTGSWWEPEYQREWISPQKAPHLVRRGCRDGIPDARQVFHDLLWHDNYTPCVQSVGCKVMLDHVEEECFAGIKRQIVQRLPNVKVILLRRDNLLYQILSAARADLTQQWSAHRRANVREPGPIEIRPEQLRARFADLENRYGRLESLGRVGRAVYNLAYEDWTSDPELHWEKLQGFLGVERVPRPAAPIRKQNLLGLVGGIQNYQSLKHEFAGDVWGRFFTE